MSDSENDCGDGGKREGIVNPNTQSRQLNSSHELRLDTVASPILPPVTSNKLQEP